MQPLILISALNCFAQTNEEQYKKELESAKIATNWSDCLKHIKKSTIFFSLTQHSLLENADFNYSLVSIIKRDIKYWGLTANDKINFADEINLYFDQTIILYKDYRTKNLKDFEDFMEKVTGPNSATFIKKASFNAAITNIYMPFVAATLRHFECVVEKAMLAQKINAALSLELHKTIAEINAFKFLVEAPVPTATTNNYVARIFIMLANSGINVDANLEKAEATFKEVLSTETTGFDRTIIRHIKAQAINGLIELALRSSQYDGITDLMKIYSDSKEPLLPANNIFDETDIELLLNMILLNANAYKNANVDKKGSYYLQNLKELKAYLEKATLVPTTPDILKNKAKALLIEVDRIIVQKLP